MVSRCLLGGTVRARGVNTVLIRPSPQSFTTEGLHHSRGVAGSGLRPLPIFPTAASRRSLGRVESSVADHPLRPATRLSLGEPLLTN